MTRKKLSTKTDLERRIIELTAKDIKISITMYNYLKENMNKLSKNGRYKKT